MLEGVLAPVPHRTRVPETQCFGRSGFPFKSREYANSASVDYTHVDVPNALWHESHTFTCFAYPTFTGEDMQQIAKGLTKVIEAYSKKRHLITESGR